MKQFEMAGGTVTGRDHVQPLAWKNGQDALCTLDGLERNGVAVAVVSDGCGSGSHSEVGAELAARFVAYALWGYIPRYIAGVEKQGKNPLVFRYWEDVRKDLLSVLRPIAQKIDSDMTEAVRSHFLFTLIGFVVTPHASFVFSIGDGIYFVNGEMARIGPFKDNAPPYIGYDLLRSDQYDADPELCKFKVEKAMLTASVESILVGSDGVADFVLAADKEFPSIKGVKVGPISQFWEDDRYYAVPDAVRRTFALANNSTNEPDWDEERIMRKLGLLPDDTTIAVIRRAKPPKLKEEKK